MRHGEILVIHLEGALGDEISGSSLFYERDSRFLLAERLVLDLCAVTSLSATAGRRLVESLASRSAGSVRIACASSDFAALMRREAGEARFALHPDLSSALRAFSAERSRVRVVEHPLFDRIDFEMRTLLDLHRAGSEAEMILSFSDPHGRVTAQIMLIYQPARGVLKRLVHDPKAGPGQESRLEVWKNINREEIHHLAEIAFLDRTRPRCLEPEVSLGVLESLLEKGEIPS